MSLESCNILLFGRQEAVRTTPPGFSARSDLACTASLLHNRALKLQHSSFERTSLQSRQPDLGGGLFCVCQSRRSYRIR